MQNALYNHENCHQNISWVHWIQSAAVFRDGFLSKKFSGELYRYWKNSCILADGASKLWCRAAWKVWIVNWNLSTATFCDMFDIHSFPVSYHTIFFLKMEPPVLRIKNGAPIFWKRDRVVRYWKMVIYSEYEECCRPSSKSSEHVVGNTLEPINSHIQG